MDGIDCTHRATAPLTAQQYQSTDPRTPTLPCYRSMRPGCHHPNACLEAPAPSHLSILSPAKGCRQEVQARRGH